MVSMASGIAHGRYLSPTTTAAARRKDGDLCHVGLVNMRVHTRLMTLDIHVN